MSEEKSEEMSKEKSEEMSKEKSEEKRIRVSRTFTETISETNVTSLGASYTHIKTLDGIIGPNTKRVVIYHAMLDSLEGFQNSKGIEQAFLAFNRITKFRTQDKQIFKIGILDLAGNPLESLENCPPCEELIVSSTCIKNLIGVPDGVKIIRCGHSDHIVSLKGCPKSVEIIECACAPNLIIRNEDLPPCLKELIK